MKNTQKGFVNVTLRVVIIVIAAIVGYFIWSKQSQQSNTNSVSTTINQKVYTNTKLGYEITLPSTWHVKDTNVSEVSLNSPENLETFVKEEAWVKSGYTMTRPADPQDNLTISYSDDIMKYASSDGVKLTSPSLEEFVKLNTGFINPEKISFAGQTAYRINTSGMFDSETVFIQKDNQIYSITIGSKIGMDVQLSDKILSTFKFTK